MLNPHSIDIDIVYLAISGLIAWIISTLAGGGSPLIMVPMVSFLMEAKAVAPVITIGMLLGNTQRIFMFWQHISWPVTFWYLPGAIAGAILGAYTFTKIQLEWMHLLIGCFVLVTVLSYVIGKKERTFAVSAWQFLPVGFLYAFVSGLIGSSGPIMNPFYLNYGLLKEPMVATKSTHVVVVHIAKLITYAALGVLKPEYLGYGLLIGLVAVPGNLIGQSILRRMNDGQFRQVVLATMAISGIWMLWQQRQLITFW